jgi:hypothetical protein
MKQITMNGTANALQVAAVLFLFGNSLISPADRSKETTINKTVYTNADQKNEKETRLSNYSVMGSYFHEIGEALNQPLYLHPAVTAGTINAVKPVQAAFPLSPKKMETIQTPKK